MRGEQYESRFRANHGELTQRKRLAQALAVVVNALHDPDTLLPAIAALGKRHANYGVEHHHFDSVGEALVSALGAVLGAEFTLDVQTAWTDAYALVASVMRRALIRSAASAVDEPGCGGTMISAV